MKSEQFLKKIIKRTINETLEEKADKLMDKIKKSEMEEGFDSPEIKMDREGKDFDKYEFKRKVRPYEFMKDLEMDSLTPDEFDYQFHTKDIDLDDAIYGDDEDLDPFIEGEDEPLMEGTMCEQCGGSLSEGECTECGYSPIREGIYDESEPWGDEEQSFDYVEQEEDEFEDITDEDVIEDYCNENSSKFSESRCMAHKDMLKEEIKEKLHGKQKMLDKNKNNKIDAEDFKLLRKKKNKSEVEEEMEEGNEFSGALAKAKEKGKKEFTVGGKTYPVKESIEYIITDKRGEKLKLTENEMVDLIELIINEQKLKGLKTIGKPKGLTTYEKAHKGSGKENDDYLKSVNKKMKDYLKDGSKGEYSMNPEIFPMGNGQLAKMSKKAYVPSDAVKDYVDNFTAASLENLDYDGIEPNEDWVSDLVKGSSKTGNNPKWANAVETDVNDKRDKIRKDNLLGKVKKKAYNKAPQPIVTDKTGEDEGDKVLRQLESLESKNKKLVNEEFDRMRQLLSYNRKTQ